MKVDVQILDCVVSFNFILLKVYYKTEENNLLIYEVILNLTIFKLKQFNLQLLDRLSISF